MPPTTRAIRDKLAAARPEGDELGRILDYARPHAGRLTLAMALLALHTSLGLALPWALSRLLDDTLGLDAADGLRQLDGIALALLGIFFVRALLMGLHGWLVAQIGGRILLRLRRQLFERLTTLGADFYDDRRVGELVSRVMSDVTQIQGLVTSDLAVLASSGLTFVGAALILAWRSWRLALLMALMLPPVLLLAWAYGRTMRRRGERVQDRTAEASALVEEQLGAIRLLQAFVREPLARSRFEAATQAHYAAVMGRVRASAIYGSAVGFLTLSLLSLGLWMGGREVLAGRMSAGGLVAFLVYTGMLGSAASSLVSLYGRWANALGASRRVFGLMDLEPQPASRPGALRMARARGALRVEGLRFAYRPGLVVLDGIDLVLAPGESLALVGPSGAGKSTLMQLVARFRDPDAGSLRLDGVDLRELDLSDLRRQIGWVPQDTQLFNATVADNLRIGRPEAELPVLEAAARAANAHDFIAALPDGYATRVGERGLRLSGGQRQRIAIARAILADPRLLLLDEATSSLDSESERLVQTALETLMRGRTSIVIAHRLATVRRVDRIAVMDGGRIVEQGRHAELLAAGGLYARLCQLQLRA